MSEELTAKECVSLRVGDTLKTNWSELDAKVITIARKGIGVIVKDLAYIPGVGGVADWTEFIPTGETLKRLRPEPVSGVGEIAGYFNSPHDRTGYLEFPEEWIGRHIEWKLVPQ